MLLFFDNLRFLFNVGEGFQRFCVQHRVKLSKTNGIFVTRTSTDAAGGLPGAARFRSPVPTFGTAFQPVLHSVASIWAASIVSRQHISTLHGQFSVMTNFRAVLEN